MKPCRIQCRRTRRNPRCTSAQWTYTHSFLTLSSLYFLLPQVTDFLSPPPSYFVLNLCLHQLHLASIQQKLSPLFLTPPLSPPPSLRRSTITVVMLAGCSWLHSSQMLPFITAYYPDVGSCTVPVASNTSPWPHTHTHKHTKMNADNLNTLTNMCTHMLKHVHTTLRENKDSHKYSIFPRAVPVPPTSVCVAQKTHNTRTSAHTCHFSHPSGPNICPANLVHAVTISSHGNKNYRHCSLLHATSLREPITYSDLSPRLCPDPFCITEGWTVTQTAATRQAGAGHWHHGPG